MDVSDVPRAYDPEVGRAIYGYYRESDRDTDAEKASSAIASYLHASHFADVLLELKPADSLEVSISASAFFHHVATSLDSTALWLADVFEMMLPRRMRPSLTSDEFSARFAIIDLGAQGTLKKQRSWIDEARAYDWRARFRNGLLWSNEGGEIVIASTVIRSSDGPTLGGQSGRATDPRPARDLCGDYLDRLTIVLRAMFESGGPRLGEKSDD